MEVKPMSLKDILPPRKPLSVREETEDTIKAMHHKALDSISDGSAAMRWTQAATNVANAYCAMHR
jgi:hypothetical protein